ncbi:DMT family transporter [Comamonas humi]
MTAMQSCGPAAAAATAPAGPRQALSGGAWRMLAAMVLSGTIGLVVVESGLPPPLVVLARCVLGALGLGAWVWWRRQWVAVGRGDALWIAAGGLALVFNWVALFSAYRYTSIAVATVVYHVQPLMLLAVAAWQGEPVQARKLPWLLLALLGVALASGAVTADGMAAGSWTGALLALLAAALYTVTTVATRRVAHIPPAQVAMLQMALGGGVLALAAAPMLLAGSEQGALQLSARVGALMLVLGLVHTAFMYTLMYAAYQRLAAPAIAALSFVYPAVALAVDLLWFGHVPTPAQWLGMGGIVVAVLVHRLGR